MKNEQMKGEFTGPLQSPDIPPPDRGSAAHGKAARLGRMVPSQFASARKHMSCVPTRLLSAIILNVPSEARKIEFTCQIPNPEIQRAIASQQCTAGGRARRGSGGWHADRLVRTGGNRPTRPPEHRKQLSYTFLRKPEKRKSSGNRRRNKTGGLSVVQLRFICGLSGDSSAFYPRDETCSSCLSADQCTDAY